MPTKLPEGKHAVQQTYGEGRTICPYENTIDLIGDKWSLMILRNLKFQKGTCRFNQLMRALKGISSKTLSEKLRELVENGILNKTVISVTPVVIHYTLTEKGEGLIPILDAMAAWSDKWEKDGTR